MHLGHRHIEIFHAIMSSRSVTAAAAQMRTSQPTISRELKALEIELGFPLFHRFGRRLTPTPQALALHETVRRSYLGIAEINRAADAIAGNQTSYLRVACLPAYAETLLPQAAQPLRELRVALAVHALEEPILRQDLTSQLFDIALTEGVTEPHSGMRDSLEPGNEICILPVGHHLASRSVLEPGDFHGENFIYFNQDDPYRRRLDEIFEAAGVERRLAIETTTATSVCAMVAAGLGISIINPLSATFHRPLGLVLRPFSVAIPYRINILQTPRGQRQLVASRFIEILRDVCTRVAAEHAPANGPS